MIMRMVYAEVARRVSTTIRPQGTYIQQITTTDNSERETARNDNEYSLSYLVLDMAGPQDSPAVREAVLPSPIARFANAANHL